MFDQMDSPKSCPARARRIAARAGAGLWLGFGLLTVGIAACDSGTSPQDASSATTDPGVSDTVGTGVTGDTFGQSSSESPGTGADSTGESGGGWSLAAMPVSSLEQSRILTDNAAWQAVSPESDPHFDHRPAVVACRPGGWFVEFDALEVDTGECNYFAMYQPTQHRLAAGERLRLLLWHAKLAALEPAQAHIELTIGPELVWQRRIAIPGEANAFDLSFEVPVDVPVGTAIVLHLHNHGYNTWNLMPLQLAAAWP